MTNNPIDRTVVMRAECHILEVNGRLLHVRDGMSFEVVLGRAWHSGNRLSAYFCSGRPTTLLLAA